jgi:hypothetical protein
MQNPFITEKCDAEATAKLVEAGLPIMESDGKVHWSAVEEGAGTNVGYGRGWLVVRWAYLAKYDPTSLVDSTKLISDAFKKAEKEGKSGDFDEKTVLQAKVIELRDVEALSWGEIAVRMQIPESRVRAAYRHNGIRKDLGLRIGKGGRFAYDAGELYTDNRRKEGAHIPLDMKAKPKVEDLLNFLEKTSSAKQDEAKRKATISRLLKIQDLLENAGTPQAQRDTQKARLAELLKKHGITMQDLAKARAAKGRKAA